MAGNPTTLPNLRGLRNLLEAPVDALGYELLHLEFEGRGQGGVLRVYIDAPGGICVDDCEAVSRQVNAVLDAEDALHPVGVLEVSSPGLDRPLVKPDDFRRFAGRRARVVLKVPVNGRRRFVGELVETGERGVVMAVDGERYELAYTDMDTARLEPVFETSGHG